MAAGGAGVALDGEPGFHVTDDAGRFRSSSGAMTARGRSLAASSYYARSTLSVCRTSGKNGACGR